ncbi:PAS domain-containing protein [Leisingera sp. S132]|uniref:PAS domain-containing protein n=1 Tax=Leisingera sp. S132 TaxID=2867016 RepID=UPI0021A71336|nr:PAS domain-containing protein [Leisingera sp. S132]UWQ81147.1 PAS domain-containing protein [Leisingera sp. S132]
MTFTDRRIELRPANGEAPFALDEIFFSRTDDRGVIKTGNDIFRRVSGFDWDSLLGAPHKIIRHPDMPRGVFQLFWDIIQNGDFIGAYVKNKAKDGLYYWVFAVVVPCEDGYLSVRIKPSSSLFATVKQGYCDLLKAEQDDGLSPEESRDNLLAWLAGMGFASYREFAAHALSEELESRDAGLGSAPDMTIRGLRQKLKNSEVLVTETKGLIDDFSAMRTIPHNLRVIASRIEPAGGPVTVLSQNYGSMSREMSTWFSTHVMGEDSNFAKIKDLVNQGLFVEGMARILTECDGQLQRERRSLGGIDLSAEQDILSQLTQAQVASARMELKEVDREAERITRACETMRRQFLGLSSTRVLCKIESARLPRDGATLSDIIDQLGSFQERISRRLDKISHLCAEIRELKQEKAA